LEGINAQSVRMESQIADLRRLLDFKTKEHEKLKMERNEIQIDAYRTK